MAGTETKSSKVKGTASGQYLGYALQPVRLFYHLLTCNPDHHVGLEHVDDVSIHSGETTVCAEQCKSALSQNPISDWAVDLWKTFANWTANAKNGVFDPATIQFRLYVIPSKSGNLAQRLSDATSDTDIKTILKELANKLTERPKPPECQPNLQMVLDADPAHVVAIVKNFTLECIDDDPFKPIFAHLDSSVNPKIIESACKYGIGEAMRQIELRLKAGDPPVISASRFRARFRAFITAHDGENILHSLSDAPSDEVIQNTLVAAPLFVRQLDLVGADVQLKTRAASDFLHASADRTKWAEEGLVFEGSMDEYDDGLKRRHMNLKTEL